MDKLYKYEVGKAYSETRSRWPQSSDYNFRAGAHELRLFLPDVTDSEVEDINKGRVEFRLFTRDDLLILVYRFGDMPWSDAIYNWHLVSTDEQSVPDDPTSESEGAVLTVLLIEANTGILKAIRLIGLGYQFTKQLHTEIRKQINSRFDKDSYIRKVDLAYRMYSSDQMAQMATAKYNID